MNYPEDKELKEGKMDWGREYLLKQEAELYPTVEQFIKSMEDTDLTKSQLIEIWNKAQEQVAEQPLIEEAKKYETAEEFASNTNIIPESARVWIKSKFSDDGGYTDFPIIRKEENITLYQGGSEDVRQFWTPNKKYASQFGEVKEKTGTFYQVDNGNRMTDVYVDAKQQLTDIYNKAHNLSIETL